MSEVGGKYGKRRLNRSSGPQDVRPGWLLDSAERSIGPYIEYPDGTTTDRRSGAILWRPGDDPTKKPRNPEPEPYDKPHSSGYFGAYIPGKRSRRKPSRTEGAP
jgi:hypothetical protein